jgi:hypothetical protein
MEPQERIALSSQPYQGRILLLNYCGKLEAHFGLAPNIIWFAIRRLSTLAYEPIGFCQPYFGYSAASHARMGFPTPRTLKWSAATESHRTNLLHRERC